MRNENRNSLRAPTYECARQRTRAHTTYVRKLIIILFYCGKRKGNLFKAKSVIGGQSNKYRKRTKETEIDEKNEINKTNCEKSDFAIDSGFTVIVLTSHHHQFIVEWNIFFSLRYIKANFYFIFAPNKSELNIFVEWRKESVEPASEKSCIEDDPMNTHAIGFLFNFRTLH